MLNNRCFKMTISNSVSSNQNDDFKNRIDNEILILKQENLFYKTFDKLEENVKNTFNRVLENGKCFFPNEIQSLDGILSQMNSYENETLIKMNLWEEKNTPTLNRPLA